VFGLVNVFASLNQLLKWLYVERLVTS